MTPETPARGETTELLICGKCLESVTEPAPEVPHLKGYCRYCCGYTDVIVAYVPLAEVQRKDAAIATLTQTIDGLKAVAGSWQAQRDEARAEIARLTTELRVEPLHGPECPCAAFTDETLPDDVDCTCTELAARWKARACLERGERRMAEAERDTLKAALRAIDALLNSYSREDATITAGQTLLKIRHTLNGNGLLGETR